MMPSIVGAWAVAKLFIFLALIRRQNSLQQAGIGDRLALQGELSTTAGQ